MRRRAGVRWLTAIGLVTGSIAVLFLFWRHQIWSWFAMPFDSTQLRGIFAALGAWGPLASIALLTLQAVIAPLPGTLLIAANGAIYGAWCGGLMSWAGVLAGAVAAYTLGRWFGDAALGRWVNRRHYPWLDLMRTDRGFLIVIAARLMPLVSMDFIGYVAGAGRMSLGAYLLACAIGQTPAVIVYTVLGDDLFAARLVMWRLALIGLLGIALALLSRWLLRRSQ